MYISYFPQPSICLKESKNLFEIFLNEIFGNQVYYVKSNQALLAMGNCNLWFEIVTSVHNIILQTSDAKYKQFSSSEGDI